MAISNPQSDFVFPSGRELQSRVRLGGNPSSALGQIFPRWRNRDLQFQISCELKPKYSKRNFDA
jgi:hypothetical protein